ncbi:dTDP-4-amino-4,6-dideoxygalactose transaminase [Aequitasia blattaphilus]|uniref:dTDP-4-amino-4,6-dideoxygalactose transaminase n=1 Tax=Aequitasia blattaphilus TaxID=2949332 RepID=A0ABT1E8P4_9FIRM|nr:dTDP-4-amino-4,6-dideoxygalactose transaminase [Aequitasia blattaphilus]MCP1101256.1 dTDP-4-amino-4,6-dideoxygalactose transaminase [Aequitasia blattaphilus]MCR8613896.1 dTDP-4-amino-4,6-dideoxygalactose transaminase [Aequitasia blattaphilus]
MIKFNVPPYLGSEMEYIQEAILNHKISGDGLFTQKCSRKLEQLTKSKKVLLTTSCTHAIEMAAILAGVGVGDEVIMPSYTFVSTANAFVLRGAKVKFVDIRPDTMNIDENLIEAAITERTKAIVPVHYAGVGCEMSTICALAKDKNIHVIEDAAQGVKSTYKGKSLGSMGAFGCFSFHETKNYSMGEGGALLINDSSFREKAEIIREKGTDRSKFFRGEVDKYSWVDVGSSYLPSELNAAYLLTQLENADLINSQRKQLWEIYYKELKNLSDRNYIELPYIPKECEHNAHMFYIKVKDLETRSKLIKHLKDRGVNSVFHYVPLHSSDAGMKYCDFVGEDNYTTSESERLLRLPLYYGLDNDSVYKVVEEIEAFFK